MVAMTAGRGWDETIKGLYTTVGILLLSVQARVCEDQHGISGVVAGKAGSAACARHVKRHE